LVSHHRPHRLLDDHRDIVEHHRRVRRPAIVRHSAFVGIGSYAPANALGRVLLQTSLLTEFRYD
jgi:hypothetical protein